MLSGEVDFRPASVRMIQEMRQEIINEMERKFESLRKVQSYVMPFLAYIHTVVSMCGDIELSIFACSR